MAVVQVVKASLG